MASQLKQTGFSKTRSTLKNKAENLQIPYLLRIEASPAGVSQIRQVSA